MTANQPSRRWSELGDSRLLVVATLISSLGLGAYTTGSLLYFTQVVGLSIAEVGAGLSVAGLLALAASIPAGRLTDLVGHQRLSFLGGVVHALLLTAVVFVHSFGQFVGLISAVAVVDQVVRVARSALVSSVSDRATWVAVGAYLQSAFNLGVTVGIAVAGIAIVVDTPLAYRMVVLSHALAALAAGLLTAVIRTRFSPADNGVTRSGWRAVRDLPYVTVAMLYGLITVSDVMLNVGLPLWLVTYTDVPKSMAAWLIGVNAVLIVAFQVRASAGATDLAAAGRRLRWAAISASAAALLFALTAELSWQASAVLLVLGVLVLTAGELLASPAATFLRYELAAPEAQGIYGGVFSLAGAIRSLVGPSLITLLMASLHGWGWAALAVMFLGLVLVTSPVLTWAQRTRGRYLDVVVGEPPAAAQSPAVADVARTPQLPR